MFRSFYGGINVWKAEVSEDLSETFVVPRMSDQRLNEAEWWHIQKASWQWFQKWHFVKALAMKSEKGRFLHAIGIRSVVSFRCTFKSLKNVLWLDELWYLVWIVQRFLLQRHWLNSDSELKGIIWGFSLTDLLFLHKRLCFIIIIVAVI